ncbi:MAG TPA: ADP-ribosylglycohydrolase family protein [Puia sp.]|nr:ADP-ribosylglycohydrolase family protein [Puia sp.]
MQIGNVKRIPAQIILSVFCLSLFCIMNSRSYAQNSALRFTPTINGYQPKTLTLSVRGYENKVQAIWIGQMAAAIMGWPFEHHTASVEWINKLPAPYNHLGYAPVDDDWYYEMVALRAFEKYGVGLKVQQLCDQWKENACGTWGSSEQARLLICKGILAPESGNPRYNKLWWTIGSQFSADIYGALAPGLPNVAAKMAREYGHINGYAEGADGAVFVAGMISLGFIESDPKVIVRKAAKLISPRSPYRKCIDLVIKLAEEGKSAREINNATEDRWHSEYPATNNAVANGGIIAASVWFGGGDFLKTVNLAYSAADFTDADCNAANAASVIGAMRGLKAIPEYLIGCFGDRIMGDKLGDVVLTPAVDERISVLSKRTVVVGEKILEKNGAKLSGDVLNIVTQSPKTQPAELFNLGDLTKYWNPAWTLERAGFGGAGGGMPGIRGNTYLDGEVLATYPRDEIRGLVLSRTLKVNGEKQISFEAGVDSGRAWELNVFINNRKMFANVIEGREKGRRWQTIKLDISSFEGQTVKIRLYQRVLITGKEAGNAYWKHIEIR